MYFQKTNIKEIEQEIVTLSKKLGVPEFNPNIHYSDLDLVKYETDIRAEIVGRNENRVTTAVVSFVVGFAVFFRRDERRNFNKSFEGDPARKRVYNVFCSDSLNCYCYNTYEQNIGKRN